MLVTSGNPSFGSGDNRAFVGRHAAEDRPRRSLCWEVKLIKLTF
ncbi:hypothetical protein S1001342_02938 (plasmid) [Acetobacter pasteurianus subsp. pasteurianus]|uniref:Uncharacterized protein n=1 Tax=Acetobacter pasteurianus subsp. pasteurianus TaxID=481145 RepID=A0A1Y0Y1Z4_ACEPA|nr:hypothetical protein S1001342_02938 [Acetobacter pasteurianus subsp. pasteurianus]